jgi:hypothetical protein
MYIASYEGWAYEVGCNKHLNKIIFLFKQMAVILNKKKMTNNYLQNTTQKNKVRATRIPLKPGVNSGAPEG